MHTSTAAVHVCLAQCPTRLEGTFRIVSFPRPQARRTFAADETHARCRTAAMAGSRLQWWIR